MDAQQRSFCGEGMLSAPDSLGRLEFVAQVVIGPQEQPNSEYS